MQLTDTAAIVTGGASGLGHATAVALAPLPRCRTMTLASSTGRPTSSAARRETKACDVPWKP